MPRQVRGRKKDKHDRAKLDPANIEKHLDSVGVETKGILARGRKRDRSRGAKAKSDGGDDMDTEVDTTGMSKGAVKKLKKERADSTKREQSLARSHSKPRSPSQVGLRDEEMKQKATKKDMAAKRSWAGFSGEGDHRKTVHLVKWMNTGKKRNGTHYCR